MIPNFSIKDKVIVVTGGGGAICGTMSRTFGESGAKVAVLDLRLDLAQKIADEITASGGIAIGVECNVLDKASIEKAAEIVVQQWGQVDILINGAGGNKPAGYYE